MQHMSTHSKKAKSGHPGGSMAYLGPAGGPAKDQFFAREGVDPLSSAFEKKTTIHAGMSGRPIPREEVKTRYAELMDTERSGPCAAYFHIPFCETHCLYCGFYSAPYREGRSKLYTDRLIAEIKAEKDTKAVQSGSIDAVYLGGGTPTTLEPEDMKRLLETIRTDLPLSQSCEITVEGRILNFGEEKMRACLEGGANRFSLGVQTFDTQLRQQLGRSCAKDEVRDTLATLKKLGNAAVIIDLIYGLPGQTLASWEADINMALELGLDGVDLYQLNIYPDGRLDKALKDGTLPPAADIPGQSAFFAAGVAQMQAANMRRLSITHWGRTDQERNIYNSLSKKKSDCLAFGAGAGGMLGGVFYYTERDYKKYMEAELGQKPILMMAESPKNMNIVQALIAQLEMGALDLAHMQEATGIDAVALFAPLLQQWEKTGLLTRQGSRVELTLAGQFWQINLTQALIEWYKMGGSMRA